MNDSTKSNSAKRLDTLIAAAATEAERYSPPRDLWRGIEHGISRQQQQAPTWLRYVWASAAVLVIAIGTMTMQWLPQDTGAQSPEMATLITTVNQHHASQRELLLTSLQSSGLGTAEISNQTELEQLRQAAAQVTEQLQGDPNNRALWELLQWLHQQELELLKANFAPRQTWQQV